MNLIHALDQMQAALRDLAPVLYSYYDNLKKQGFTSKQALTIVIELQRSLLSYKE